MTDRAREIAHKHCTRFIHSRCWQFDNRYHSKACDALTADIVAYGREAIASKPPLYRIDGATGAITEALCAECGAKL